MTRWVVPVILLLVGLLNMTPAIVFFDPARTVQLYGITMDGEDISILTRHRAVLLGLLGAAMIYAAFRRDAVVPVIVGALIGKAAFLFLVASAAGPSSEIWSVATFDMAAVVLLLVAGAIHFTRREAE